MTQDEIVSLIEEAASDNGIEIERIDCAANPVGGWDVSMKAEGNPFSSDDYGDDTGQELLVPLRGRDCKYHSTRLGEKKAKEWGTGKEMPGDLIALWTSTVEAWDEHTDAPDTHRITAWIGPEGLSEGPRRSIRTEFERDLASEMAGDLYLVTSRLGHLTQPLGSHQKEVLKGYVSTLMRSIACL